MNKKYSKEYRNRIGFSSKSKCFAFFKAKDIQNINWQLIKLYNNRLIQIGVCVQNQLIVPNDIDVEEFINQSFEIIKANQIIENYFTNHGRANELVYYSWMLGYVVETLFVPFIKEKLNLNEIVRTGGDDLKNPETFDRTGNSDLFDPTQNIAVDVQCGGGEGEITIKKSKVDYAIKNEYNGFVFTIGLSTGLYGIVNLNSLEKEKFVANPSWEGALCWTAPDDIFLPWSHNYE
jgi:hypothetical protein